MTREEPFVGILVSTANEKTARKRTDVSGLAGTDSRRVTRGATA
jgi:hypothetical protein